MENLSELVKKEEVSRTKDSNLGENRYISEEKVPALWRPPCACGIALPTKLYRDKIRDYKINE